MALTGSISRNSITPTGPAFQVDLNIEAQATPPTASITSYDFIRDGVVESNVTFSPTANYSNIITYIESDVGTHTYEIKFTTIGAAILNDNITLVFDHDIPTVNNFSLFNIEKLPSNDYEISIEVNLFDTIGIDRYQIEDLTDSTVETFDPIMSATNLMEMYTKTLPSGFSGTRTFRLTAWDFAGNQSVPQDTSFSISSVPPTIDSILVTGITKILDEYTLDVQITGTAVAGQNVEEYSLQVNNSVPAWEATSFVSGSFILNKQLKIANSVLAGAVTIFANVRDTSANIGANTTPFVLDKTPPVGTVDLQNIHYSGGQYYGDVLLTAQDAGKVVGYAWAFDNQNPTPFISVSPTTSFSSTISSQLIGASGANTIYAKFIDESGNQSTQEISKYFVIDTVKPEVNLELLEAEKIGSDYNFTFQRTANDNKNIIEVKFFGENSNTHTLITGHNLNWTTIPPTQIINDQQVLIVPSTETEDPIDFFWQVRDSYGNESVIETVSIDFDKTIPSISNLNYFDVEKGSSFYRIFADLSAIDTVGVTSYRADLDDVANATWQTITANTHIDERIYLDFPVADFGLTKSFTVEVRDQLGNISANSSFDVAPNMVIPVGTASISSGSFTASSFIVNFQLDANKPVGDGDVYWYSILTGDATIRDWKPLITPNNVISEIQSITIPRTSDGVQDFYVYFADEWKNESPVVHVQYDLDAVSVFGGIDLERVTFDGTNYTANVHLYAFDNKTVNEYEFNGTPNSITPIKIFDEYRLENLGNVPGLRSFDVLFRDGFGNASNTYNLTLNLENDAPNCHIRYDSTYFDGLAYNMTLTMFADDNTQLRDYKFWYGTEPATWTNFPPGQTDQQLTQVFAVPMADTSPTFEIRVRDLFDNESSNNHTKLITTTPPNDPILTVNASSYTTIGTNLSIDYSVTAAIGSGVRQLVVTPTGGFTFSVPCGNAPSATGTFDYTFPIGVTTGSFDVYAESDYGYTGTPPVTISKIFDANPPANVAISHVSSFNNGTEYIVQVRVQADDDESGITQVLIRPEYITVPQVYPVPQTNLLDEIFNIVIPSTYGGSDVDIHVAVQDLIGNQSTFNLVNCDVDQTNPIISGIVFNSGTTFGSLIEGANAATVQVQFTSSDFSNISHYKFSKTDNDVVDATWTQLIPPQSTININETVDLTSLGYTDGEHTLYIHVRDTHGNISVAGHQFELDTTQPVVTLTYLNEIERIFIGPTDHFVIPYDILYTDNFSGIKSRDKWQENTSGTVTNLFTEPVSPISNNLISNNTQQLIASNHGLVTFKENVTDRFDNLSANSEFSVYLKTNIPIINEFSLVGNAQYTNTEHIFLKLDVEVDPMHPTDDTIPLTRLMFSANNNETWSSTNWDTFVMGPTLNHVKTHPIDLLALGFTPGTCNVYSYVKDGCQNVANSSISIVYDPDPPIVNEFRVNNVTRGFNTYDIELVANTIDSISGVHEYVISQSAIDTNFSNVGPTPIVATDVIIPEIEQVPLSDYGMKYFYFKSKDAAGNISEANTSFYIDGVLPLAASFTATSSYSNYYLSTARNQFSFVISDNNALLDVRYELNGNTYPITNYDPTLSIVNDSNTFNADFSTLSEGIYRIYLEVEDTFENVSRIPYEFYFDNDPPVISNFSIKEIRPNPAPGAASNSYTVEFSISANDTVRVNEYKLFENGLLIETISMSAVSFTASPTITTTFTGSEVKTYELKVYDLSGNETSSTITQNVTDNSNILITNFVEASSTASDITIDYAAQTATGVNLKYFALTTEAALDYDSSLWESILGPPSNLATKTGLVRLYGDIRLQPISPQNLYLHIKDECGNQTSSSISFAHTPLVPLLSGLTPSINLKREGNFYVGDVSLTAKGTNSIVGYYIGLEHDSEKFKSVMPMADGDTMTQKFKIPVSQVNGNETLFVRLLDDTGQMSPNYRVSVQAIEHRMERFEVCASEHMASSINQVDILFDSPNDPFNIEYAFEIDSSIRPTSFTPANALPNAIGEYEFNFNVDVSGRGAGDHKLWVWLKTTQNEYSFREHDFRSEPHNTPPTASLSVIKAHVYQGKKIVYVEMQVTDLGVGVSEVSIIESGTHTFKTIPTTNFKKHIEIFEYPLSDTSTITYSGVAKDASGNQSSTASTTMNLGSII